MLARILEPEVMDSAEEARDYDSMDHSTVNRAFVEDLLQAAANAGLFLSLAGAPSAAATEMLDLGTGTALIPVELCRRNRGVQVVAIDLAEEMLKLGRANVDRAGMQTRIRLERVDGKRLPYADGSFAAVISNSIVHHIPEPRSVLAEALRVVRRGGLVFVRDLLRPADDATVGYLVETYAAGANERQRALFDASLRAALSLEEIRMLVETLECPSATVQATSDRHWTWSMRK
ncbi:MAG TPA: class I SAM-dependent methyltransferase [Pirellulales bacterium]|nr:class I SAM-dependent methyltransferase [Pirellulales bacterium]